MIAFAFLRRPSETRGRARDQSSRRLGPIDCKCSCRDRKPATEMITGGTKDHAGMLVLKPDMTTVRLRGPLVSRNGQPHVVSGQDAAYRQGVAVADAALAKDAATKAANAANRAFWARGRK